MCLTPPGCIPGIADRPARSTVLIKRALVIILATVTLDAAGIGLALPVIPTPLREISLVTRIAGRFGDFMAIYPFMQFLFAPVLGRLSDRIGRRPVLLVSLGVASIDYLIMGLSPLLPRPVGSVGEGPGAAIGRGFDPGGAVGSLPPRRRPISMGSWPTPRAGGP